MSDRGYAYKIPARSIEVPNLPSFIVANEFDRHVCIPANDLGQATAVPYSRVGGLKSGDPGLAAQFRERVGLSLDQLILIHGEGPDDEQERIFGHVESGQFFAACAQLSPVVLIAPGLSVYTDGTQCRLYQLYNMARMFH